MSFWAIRDSATHAEERILPTGTVELVINLHEDRFRIRQDGSLDRTFSGAIISGAYQRPFLIDTRDHASIIGIHFNPGAASSFLGLPASELEDLHVDLHSLWGADARRLREQLCEAEALSERFQILEQTLLRRPFRDREPHPAVPESLDLIQRTNQPVGRIARQLGLSHRRFIQLFTRYVGMTPKLFSRVWRFQKAWKDVRSGERVEWSDLAARSGYFDQSHLIRDFTAFSGMTPTDLLRHRMDIVKENHVAED